jgi:hypothetical protein
MIRTEKCTNGGGERGSGGGGGAGELTDSAEGAAAAPENLRILPRVRRRSKGGRDEEKGQGARRLWLYTVAHRETRWRVGQAKTLASRMGSGGVIRAVRSRSGNPGPYWVETLEDWAHTYYGLQCGLRWLVEDFAVHIWKLCVTLKKQIRRPRVIFLTINTTYRDGASRRWAGAMATPMLIFWCEKPHILVVVNL